MTWIQERYSLPTKCQAYSEIPEELKGLTQLEEMLIARVYPLMTVYTVKGGQRKGSNHVINFPQNVSRIANMLPQLPSDLPLVVRRINAEGTHHYDFRVRQAKVRTALTWLKENNKWYRDIVISEERLSQLGEDTNIEDEFGTGMDQNGIEMMDVAEGEGAANPSDGDMGMKLNVMALIIEHVENPLVDIHAGITENPCPTRSEDEEIEHLLQQFIATYDDPSNKSDDEYTDEELDRLLQEWTDDGADGTTNEPIRWPTQGEAPVNEYTTEGYIAMAFPSLFPYGRADFRDQSRRETSLGIAEYFNALLRYKDGRFGNHPRYLLK